MHLFRLLSVVLIGFLASACGGGGGSGERPGEADLTILIGDGPIDDLEEAWTTVRELRLNMAGGNSHVVLDEPQDIELLGLRNLTEVLLMEKIVSGKVNKIRLLLDDLRIVYNDGSEATLPVPAGGWVELNPQGGIDVRAGESIHVMIDLDMKRSVQVVQGGNGQFSFRPQVFVEIYSDGDPSRLVRLKGVARGVNNTIDGWDLCDLRRVAGDGSNENLLDCVHINDQGATTFENGAVLEEGTTVTAFGFMDFSASEDTMNAEILVTGEAEPIVSEHGLAETIAPDAVGILTKPDTVDELLVTANLLNGAKSFSRDDPPADLMVGDDVEAFGFSTGPGSIDAFLLIYQTPPE